MRRTRKLLAPFLPAQSRRIAKVGDRIHWEGDMANRARSGEVVAVEADRWGTRMEIRWDETENIGWQDGEAVTYTQPTTKIQVSIVESPRWHFEDEYLAKREAAIEEMKARYAAIVAARG